MFTITAHILVSATASLWGAGSECCLLALPLAVPGLALARSLNTPCLPSWPAFSPVPAESGLAAVQLSGDSSVHKLSLDDVSEYSGPLDAWE